MTTKTRYLLVTLLGSCAYCSDLCPPPELIAPCTCFGWTGGIECVDIVEMEVLQRVFDRSADYKFRDFSLRNSSVLYLPAEIVVHKKMKYISIDNTTMSSLFDTEVDENNDVEKLLAVKVVFQRGLSWEGFRNLKKLTSIRVLYTETKALDQIFKDNIGPRLTELSLRKANIKKVHPTAFSKLKDLAVIDLSYAQLKSMSRSWFPKPAAITDFTCRYCKLKSLPDDLFSDMPKILKIMLDGNQLTSISETIFGSVYDQLYFLTMQENPIKCDCSVRWVLKKLKTKMRPMLHAICAYPDDKKGKRVDWFVYDDFKYCDQ